MAACDLGVAVFEQLVEPDFNPNVSLEVGYMLAQKKKLLLLKERSLPRLSSDLVGHLYKEFDAGERYKSCLEQLQGLIEPNAEVILAALDGRP